MKIFNITFGILFILFAALQYNDPDPYVWMPIYLYSTWLCFDAAKGKFIPWANVLGLVVYGAYTAYLFFDKTGVLNWAEQHHAENIVQSMKAEKPWIEETREFGGLLILIVVILINWWHFKRKTN
jgi:hypothetical protein